MIVLAVLAGVAVMGMCVVVIGLALFLPAMGTARQAAWRSHARNNLQQIGLAVFNYHDVHQTFPPTGTFTADNKPHHGWHTMILPYMEQASLYNTIDQSVAWDDPRNRVAFGTPIQTFHNPMLRAPAQQFNAAGLALSHYAMNSKFGGPNKALRIAEILDGTSNTVMGGEVGSGFLPWGDPTSARDPAQGLGASSTQFGGVFKGGGHLLLGDGSVRFVSDSVDLKVLDALSTPAGGEVVGEF